MQGRLRIYPGVEPGRISQIIRSWVNSHRIGNVEAGFSDLLTVSFKQVPRLWIMMKYHALVRSILMVVKNGVLGHKNCKDAFQMMFMQQPGLVKSSKEKILLFQLSSGLRVLLTWYRAYAKAGKIRAKLLKRATATQRKVLDNAIKDLELKNKEPDDEENHMDRPDDDDNNDDDGNNDDKNVGSLQKNAKQNGHTGIVPKHKEEDEEKDVKPEVVP